VPPGGAFLQTMLFHLQNRFFSFYRWFLSRKREKTESSGFRIRIDPVGINRLKTACHGDSFVSSIKIKTIKN
jgi:hypothetical protein